MKNNFYLRLFPHCFILKSYFYPRKKEKGAFILFLEESSGRNGKGTGFVTKREP